MEKAADSWLTVEEVAAHLKVSKESIYRWIEAKRIPVHRVGRLWRFSKAEVDAWVVRGEADERSRGHGHEERQ